MVVTVPPPLLVYNFLLPIILPILIILFLVLVLVRGGWVNMNLMKHNLVHRGFEEYNAGILSLLVRIMGKGKCYTSRGGATVTTIISDDYINQKLVARVPRSQPEK